ncbi:DUF58 domain-containing protein [Natronobiforma cellulositropha]|uniref:DUF58 domain-containing protein n=1 Tax=Natronobiforma cellulositropha TaxID=1679076 RepID=UPI0021D5AD07|nr:DUF58 domain-containing protein [Natronobiforma cellulositropha]
MHLTRRGWGVVVVVAFCILMAWGYGERSLNALVAPLLVGLLAAAISTYRIGRPTVERRAVDEGFPGETRPVAVDISAERPTAATVADRVGAGLGTEGNSAETTLTADTCYRYDLTLETRGEHRVGPLSITVTDVLGLVSRRFEYTQTVSVLVYPAVYDLRSASGQDLRLLAEAAREQRREEFDSLREYNRGDSLRDVHWKSTAKRPEGDLIVKRFAADETAGAVDVVAESSPETADEMASAAASVVAFLLELDVDVELTVAEGSVRTDGGFDRRHHLYRLLARTAGGALTDERRRQADVVIVASDGGVVVRVGERDLPFDHLRTTLEGSDRWPDSGDTASEVAA